MSVSVVIVAFKLHAWLVPCLRSVLHQAEEVLVVDNGSPGAAVSAAASECGARSIRLKRNHGFAGGVNAGVRVAQGDVIALLNDDAIADEEWIETSSAALEDPDVAAVGPKILFSSRYAEVRLDDEVFFAPGDPRPLGRCLRSVNVGEREVLPALLGSGVHRLEEGEQGGVQTQWRWTSGGGPIFVPLPAEAADEAILVDGEAVETIRHVELINNAGSYLSAEGHGGDYGFIAPDDGGFDQAADRFAVSGAAMMARRETFARLGLFATPFFAYYEDLDWCWRAQLAGMRVRYEPQSIVRHVGGVSTGGPLSSRVRFLAARNRMHTLARNAPLHVLWWQLRRPPPEFPPAGLDRALATRLPRGLLERRRLARRWKRSPAEVWSQWAGVGEGWSVTE